MKKAIAILALGLPLALAYAETEHDFEERQYGNWTAITGEPDPFNPNRWAKAYNVAKANSKITGDFFLSVECNSDKPGTPQVAGPFFYAAYTNFQHTEYGDAVLYAHIAALFDGGKPRRIKVWHEPGGNNWFIDNSTDTTWLRNSLLEKDRLYVRWDEFRTGQVTAEFDLTGTTDAFTDIKGRCVGKRPLRDRQEHKKRTGRVDD